MSAMNTQTDFAFRATSPVAVTYASRPGVTLSQRLVALVQWVAEAPRRRAVINQLESLSDYELADIGLSRAELPRVFDRDFATGRA